MSGAGHVSMTLDMLRRSQQIVNELAKQTAHFAQSEQIFNELMQRQAAQRARMPALYASRIAPQMVAPTAAPPGPPNRFLAAINRRLQK